MIISESLLARYLTNLLSEFHHIYNFDAVEHKDELVRGQRSRSHQGQIDTLGGIFLSVSGVHGCILTKLSTITHYQVRMTLVTVCRSRIQRSGCVYFVLHVNSNNFTSISVYTVGRGI